MAVGTQRKMDRVLKTIVFGLAFINGVYLKELNVKKDLEVKDKNIKDIVDVLNNDDTYIKNERFARHLEAVTESVLEHLVAELKHQYGKTATHKTPMVHLLKRIKSQLKRNNLKRIVMRNKKKIKKKFKGKRLGTMTEKRKGKNWQKP